jgi:Na+/proline symporter
MRNTYKQSRLESLGSNYQFVLIILLLIVICSGFAVRIVNNTNIRFTFTAFDDPSEPGFLYNGRSTLIYWSTQLTTVLIFLTICVTIFFVSIIEGRYSAISSKVTDQYQNINDDEKSRSSVLRITRYIVLTIMIISLILEIIFLVANGIEISKCNKEPYNICNDIRWCCVFSEPNAIMSGCPIYTQSCQPAISPSIEAELNWDTAFLISFVINIAMALVLIILICIILFINTTVQNNTTTTAMNKGLMSYDNNNNNNETSFVRSPSILSTQQNPKTFNSTTTTKIN